MRFVFSKTLVDAAQCLIFKRLPRVQMGAVTKTTCYYCSAGIGSTAAIHARHIEAHVAFSANSDRVWLVCSGCGRWNLQEASAELYSACVDRFAEGRRLTLAKGVEHRNAGALRITRVDASSDADLFRVRHAGLVEARRARQQRLGLAIAAPMFAVSAAAQFLIPGGFGGYLGSALSGAALVLCNAVNRERFMTIHVEDEPPYVLRRKDATAATLFSDGSDWAIEVATRDGPHSFRGVRAIEVLSQILTFFAPGVIDPSCKEVPEFMSLQTADRTVAGMLQRRLLSDTLASGRREPRRRKLRALAPRQRLALEAIVMASELRVGQLRDAETVRQQYDHAQQIAQIIDEQLGGFPSE